MTSRLVVNNIDNDTGVTTIRLNPTYSSFELNNAERLRINSVGKVGIKTDNPTELLHLYATSAHRILLKREGAAPSEVTFGNESNYAVITNNTNGIDLRTGSTPTSSMHIDQNGKVGIGTDNPTYNLHVYNGAGNVTSRVESVAGDSLLNLSNTGNANWSGINFVRERSTGTGVVGGSIWMPSVTANNSALLYLQTQTASAHSGVDGALVNNNGVRLKLASQPGGVSADTAFSVEVGDSERLRIKSDGQVRIQTDGTNDTPAKLQLHSEDTSISSGDHIGEIRFTGRDSAGAGTEAVGALIDVTAAADWNTGATGYYPSNIDFHTQSNTGTDTVAAGPRLRITSNGTIQCGTSGVLKAEINNAVSGHQFISQCDDNENGFEVYQQHGSTATRNTFACYDNRGNSASKQQSFAVRGDGVVLIQATSSSGSSDDNIGFTHVVHGTSPYIRIRHQYSNSTGHTLFHMLGASGNLIGEIKQDGSGGVTYHSASDYRLKENVVDLTGAITRLKNLKPKRFNFKISTDVTQDGFLAHELQEVVPIAVSGTKDEVVTDDSKSKIPTLADKDIGDPVYQTVDTSRVVPLLTAALQEAITKIETLETKVAALEGS